jgi:DNA replication protein DnaC
VVLQSHQLQPQLKALRLGGMLDTLDTRLQQAQQAKAGYLVFLQWLVEDEIARRHNKALGLRLQRARFEEQRTLESYDFTFNPKIPAAQIHDLATCRFIEQGESVIICGPVGVGKSHVAQALGHAACRLGHSTLYIKTNRLLADLGGGHADGTWETRLRRYLALDLLILDDFGMRAFSEPQTEDLWELIGERRHSNVVISNRSPQDWYALFPNPVLAESVLDRLVNSAHHLVLEGASYRPQRRPDRLRTAPGSGPEPKSEPTARSASPADRSQ